MKEIFTFFSKSSFSLGFLSSQLAKRSISDSHDFILCILGATVYSYFYLNKMSLDYSMLDLIISTFSITFPYLMLKGTGLFLKTYLYLHIPFVFYGLIVTVLSYSLGQYLPISESELDKAVDILFAIILVGVFSKGTIMIKRHHQVDSPMD